MLTVDARGRRCPLPVLDLARSLRSVAVGELIVVQADDPAAGPDIQAWCRMRGQEFVVDGHAADGTPEYVVRRLH